LGSKGRRNNPIIVIDKHCKASGAMAMDCVRLSRAVIVNAGLGDGTS
jgi:hypothetical protein